MPKLPGAIDDIKKLGKEAVISVCEVVGDINQFIDQINEALGTFKLLGLSIEMMSMKVVPPEADIKLTGALDAFNGSKAQELIKSKENNPLLSLTLQAFRTIALLKKPLSEVGFKGVNFEIKAGIPPKIDFNFLK